jgi:hypothetical protein
MPTNDGMTLGTGSYADSLPAAKQGSLTPNTAITKAKEKNL